jgi:DNA-binding CsgD family transcriptional regulator
MGVLRLLVRGASYKEIAAARSVSPKTVDHQVQHLFRKFGVRSRGELVAHVLTHGIVTLTRV